MISAGLGQQFSGDRFRERAGSCACEADEADHGPGSDLAGYALYAEMAATFVQVRTSFPKEVPCSSWCNALRTSVVALMESMIGWILCTSMKAAICSYISR